MSVRRSNFFGMFAALVVAVGFVGSSLGSTIGFVERFENDQAGWTDTSGAVLLDWVSGGGVDGPGDGFARTTFNYVNTSTDDQSPVLMRANVQLGASGGELFGNWIDEDVSEFSAWVRHDAPIPLNYYARFATPFNFPGGFALKFAPVFPNQWTKITIDIDPNNPEFVTFEGQTFADVFSNVGRVQIGVSTPEALAGVDRDVVFDVDSVSIVPEPGGLMLLGGLLGVLGVYRKSHSNHEGLQ